MPLTISVVSDWTLRESLSLIVAAALLALSAGLALVTALRPRSQAAASAAATRG